MTLSREDQRLLLELARAAIECHLAQRPPPDHAARAALDEPCGAFVTLKKRPAGELRGCVGYVEPILPLGETVSRAAVAAAMRDGRFAGVTAAELPQLTVEISALGPTRRVAAEEVEVGTHGLMIRCAGAGGVLLPHVAVEQGWDRDAFLVQICRKAGLPNDAWKRPDAQLFAFTALVFGEDSP
jgi:AmmeMemoRadiSam system protein A